MIKIGDQVNLMLDKNGYFISSPNPIETLLQGTVIEIYNNDNLLIAWKDDVRSTCSEAFRLTKDDISIECSKTFGDYKYACWAHIDYIATYPDHSMTIQCKACLNYNNYASSNQEDGTFICYSCRS